MFLSSNGRERFFNSSLILINESLIIALTIFTSTLKSIKKAKEQAKELTNQLNTTKKATIRNFATLMFIIVFTIGFGLIYLMFGG